MKFTDFKKIKGITFKYPELMREDSEQQVIKLFNDIETLKEKIANMRFEANSKEKELLELQKKWNLIKDLISVEYNSYEKDYTVNNLNVGFKFSADINKNIH